MRLRKHLQVARGAFNDGVTELDDQLLLCSALLPQLLQVWREAVLQNHLRYLIPRNFSA